MITQTSFNGTTVHYQNAFPLLFGSELTELPEDDISRTIYDAILSSGMLPALGLDKRNCHGYPVLSMLTAVLLAFAENGYASVRQIERNCRFDKRYIFLFHGNVPSHMTFARFIKDHLPEDRLETAFTCLNEYIASQLPLNLEDLHIDGTKIEANANKFTFVWKGQILKYQAAAREKGYKLIVKFNKQNAHRPGFSPFPVCQMVTSTTMVKFKQNIADILNEDGILFVYGKGKRKHPLQRMYDELDGIALRLFKYESYLELMGNRRSMSKTDFEATMLHMKYDYYCNTGVFKPGYNVQLGVADGFIWNLLITPDANDMPTYIPFMDKYYENYGCYPVNASADAGYGSYDNYLYNLSKGINSYIKFPQWKMEHTNSKKNEFKPFKFTVNEKGNPVCPQGHEMHSVSNRRDYRNEKAYPRFVTVYACDHCENCPVKGKCTKSSGPRKVRKTVGLDELQADAREKLSSEKGVRMQADRSIMAEGVFGQIKEDYKFSRFHRRGSENVKTELLLVVITFNLRKLHRKLHNISEEPELVA